MIYKAPSLQDAQASSSGYTVGSLASEDVGLVTLTPTDIEAQLLTAAEDPAFREALLQNPQRMWQQRFGQTSVASWQLRVFEDTGTVLHLIVPVVDQELREALRSQPEAVWQQVLSDGKLWGHQIHVVEQQLDEFCLVLPWIDPAATTAASEVGLWGGWSLQRHGASEAKAQGQPKGRPNRQAAKAQRMTRMTRNRGVAEVRRLSPVQRLMQPFLVVRAWLFKWRRL